MQRILCAFFLSLWAGPALAQEDGWRLGLIGLYADEPRDQTRDASVLPLISYQAGPWTFGGTDLVTYTLGNTEGIHGTLGLGYDFGQDALGGSPEVDGATTGQASLSYRHPFFEVTGAYEQRLDTDAGALFDVSLGTGYPIAPETLLTGSLSATWADTDYHQAYFQTDREGLVTQSLGLTLIHTLAEDRTLLLGLSTSQFDNTISALPFIRDDRANSLLLGLTWDL